MTTELHPIGNGINRLSLRGVTLLSLDEVDSWLFALDLSQEERKEACRQIMKDGYYTISNIEYRVTVSCCR